MQMFSRFGTKFAVTAYDTKGNALHIIARPPCRKCSGPGKIDCYRHVEGGRCFRCEGRGYEDRPEVIKLYSADDNARLDAIEAKKAAKRAANAQAAREQEKADAEANRDALAGTDELFARLQTHIPTKNDFVASIVQKWEQYGDISEAQRAALTKALDRMDEWKAEQDKRKASQYVGAVGDRIEIKGVITMVRDFSAQGFGMIITKVLVKIKGDDGNEYAWFASKWPAPIGSRIEGKATVKAFKEFKGVRETQITRFIAPKVKQKLAA